MLTVLVKDLDGGRQYLRTAKFVIYQPATLGQNSTVALDLGNAGSEVIDAAAHVFVMNGEGRTVANWDTGVPCDDVSRMRAA